MIGLGAQVRMTGDGITGEVGVVVDVDAPTGGYAARYTVTGPVGAAHAVWSIVVGVSEFEPALSSEVASIELASALAELASLRYEAHALAMESASNAVRVWHLETVVRRLADSIDSVASKVAPPFEQLAADARSSLGREPAIAQDPTRP